MHTNDDDADLERVEFDFSRAKPVNRPRSPAGFGIVIDRAVGYSLRLIPSNKILGRFASTHGAWSAVIAAVEAGRSSRLLILDWHGADESSGPVASGVTLKYLARSGLGLPAEHLRSPDQRGR